MKTFKVVGYKDKGRSFDTFEEARKFVNRRRTVARFLDVYHDEASQDLISRHTRSFIQEEFKISSFGE